MQYLEEPRDFLHFPTKVANLHFPSSFGMKAHYWGSYRGKQGNMPKIKKGTCDKLSKEQRNIDSKQGSGNTKDKHFLLEQ